jgi:hypothetical protein
VKGVSCRTYHLFPRVQQSEVFGDCRVLAVLFPVASGMELVQQLTNCNRTHAPVSYQSQFAADRFIRLPVVRANFSV